VRRTVRADVPRNGWRSRPCSALGQRPGHALGPVLERHLQHLGGVERAAVGDLLDLGLS